MGMKEDLLELKQLQDAGVLSQEEFDAQKASILAAAKQASSIKANQVAPEPVAVMPTQAAYHTQPVMPAQAGYATQPVQAGYAVQPLAAQPAGFQERPPPPGAPPGGTYKMVHYVGPQTQQAGLCCCIIGFLLIIGPGICCIIAGAFAGAEPKDQKEVYAVIQGGEETYYSLNGTIDTKVGPECCGAPQGGGKGGGRR